MTRPQKKEAGLVVATLVYSLLLFWAFAAAIAAPSHFILVIFLLIFTLIWAAFAAITFGLAASQFSRPVLIFAPPIFVVLAGQARVGSLAAASLFVIALVSAQRHLRRDIQSRIRYNTAQIFSPGARLILIGLAAVLAGLSFTALDQNIEANSLKIPLQFVETILKPAEQSLGGILPGYTADSTIDQLLAAKIRSDAGSAPPDLIVSDEELAAFHRNLAASYKLIVTGRETLPALVTAYINQSLSNLTRNSPVLAALLASLAFLLIARFLVPVLLWPTLGLIALLIHLAQKAELIFLITLPEPVERLRL